MARNRRHAEHENHERWLVSYADFITLLFAFFVVMFASSQADRSKVKQFSAAVVEALDKGAATRKVAEIMGAAPHSQERSAAPPMADPTPVTEAAVQEGLARSFQLLAKELQQDIQEGRVHVRMEERGLVVTLQVSSFFPSGGDALLATAAPSIRKIGAVLRDIPNKVRLEGHTDSLPISNGRFRNNWELASARGITVLSLLSTDVAPARMAVVAYADTLPKAANDSDEGRAQNRRVDITVLSETADRKEPLKAARNGDANASKSPLKI
jgi:chemotaxis protein MotB